MILGEDRAQSRVGHSHRRFDASGEGVGLVVTRDEQELTDMTIDAAARGLRIRERGRQHRRGPSREPNVDVTEEGEDLQRRGVVSRREQDRQRSSNSPD